jgi:hypothetical protein
LVKNTMDMKLKTWFRNDLASALSPTIHPSKRTRRKDTHPLAITWCERGWRMRWRGASCRSQPCWFETLQASLRSTHSKEESSEVELSDSPP